MFHSNLENPRQVVDYGERTDEENPPATIRYENRNALVRIKPFPLWVLVVCGITIFISAFWLARYASNFPGASLDRSISRSQPNPSVVQAHANSASAVDSALTDTNGPSAVSIVIKNMKFVPPTVEVKTGDVVEWKNEDITPHTATSSTFDSASIDPNRSWRYTFTKPGNFPYTCTFHPDMKASVTVK